MRDETRTSSILGCVLALSACIQGPGAPPDLAEFGGRTDLGTAASDLHAPGADEDLRSPPADLRGAPADLRPPADLRLPADLAPPPDLAPRPVSGTFEIDYGAGLRFTYTDHYYADATYFTPPQPTMVRLQQNGGHSVWVVYVGVNARTGAVAIDPNLSGGTNDKLGITLAESGGTLPAALRGGWQARSGSGTLTTVDLRSGGQVEGSASGTLTHISTGATATFQATFKAKLP